MIQQNSISVLIKPKDISQACSKLNSEFHSMKPWYLSLQLRWRCVPLNVPWNMLDLYMNRSAFTNTSDEQFSIDIVEWS